MGLDTTHDCWHGAYSSFNRFRYSLAKQIGIDLDEYAGYGGKDSKDLKLIEHDIMPLLNHSDCDGELSVEESKRIEKGFWNILENFDSNIESDYNFKDQIIQFRSGLIDAILRGEVVYFK